MDQNKSASGLLTVSSLKMTVGNWAGNPDGGRAASPTGPVGGVALGDGPRAG